MNRRGFLLIWISTIIIGAAIILYYHFSQDELLVSFDVKGGYKIKIFLERECDVSQVVLYVVEKDNKIIIPSTFFDAIDPDTRPKYKLITTENEGLVAIVEESLPNKVYIIHDFKSGKSFPFSQENETTEMLLDRLRQLTKNENYQLAWSWDSNSPASQDSGTDRSEKKEEEK